MHFKGVELTKQKSIKYCSDNTCINIVPICCLFITPECSENLTKWYHISAGEHVCSVCYNHIHSFFSYEIENSEINSWKHLWMEQSQETPTIYDYITSTLLSNWSMCNECGKWRQINRDINLTQSEIYGFTCKMILKHTKYPCKILEDERIEFIRNHPGSFFDSIKYSVYLGSSPYIDVYDSYQVDTIGISPIRQMNIDMDSPCEGFMKIFVPFSKENNISIIAGSIDATTMDKWEHDFFSNFTGNLKNIFIGLRNLMLLLWAADPKRVVDTSLLSKCVFVRGLVRVALLVHSVPDIIKIYSAFGFLNFGFPCGTVNIFEDTGKKNVVVIGAGLSGLTAARHLSLLGASVTVLEADECFDESNRRIPSKIKKIDCLNEVYGAINNPFSFMGYQCGIEVRDVSMNLSIFDCDGQLISDDIDQFYQDLVYNFVAYLVEGSSIIKSSSAYNNWTLSDLYREYRKLRITKHYASYEGVENVYLSEIEYRVYGGTSMETISRDITMPLMMRNMFNFSYKQFSGNTIEPMTCSWDKLFSKLASSLDIKYSSRVHSISPTEKGYILSVEDGRQFRADKVLFAMSPWNYNKITSEPDWLANRNVIETLESKQVNGDNKNTKRVASKTLIIVQMGYDNDNLFWRKKIPSSSSERAFAIVPRSAEERGFCHLFKETTMVEKDNLTILQTKIFGLASEMCQKLSDENIILKILEKLNCLSDRPEGAPRPQWFEILRIDNALMSCTNEGIRYKKLYVAEQYHQDIYVTNKTGILAEPISLSNSFCIGMDAASCILKDFL